MSEEKITVYLKANQSVEVKKQDVRLGDIVTIECVEKNVQAHLKAIRVWKPEPGKKRRCVISILQIIEWIHHEYPRAQVQNLGAVDIIITYEEQKPHNRAFYALKIIFVSAVVFVGSAYSIMSFHNDVDMQVLFEKIYETVMAKEREGFSLLELSYSIGLTVGILFFFNHFGRKRFSIDPTPLEVEMRTYENDIQNTIVDTYARREKEMDVD